MTSTSVRGRRVLAAAATVAALALATACSSTGGKPDDSDGGMGAGQANTPRFTVAMVTHGPPGDTFWDLIRKGAETAAAKDTSICGTRRSCRVLTSPTCCRTRSTATSMPLR